MQPSLFRASTPLLSGCLRLQSGSDGHKVKVAGVAVSDEAGYQGGFLRQIDW